jgi:hypothetical protein
LPWFERHILDSECVAGVSYGKLSMDGLEQ